MFGGLFFLNQSSFDENGIFMLSVVFLFNQLSPIEMIVFKKKNFKTPLKISTS